MAVIEIMKTFQRTYIDSHICDSRWLSAVMLSRECHSIGTALVRRLTRQISIANSVHIPHFQEWKSD